jgi:hypothetical protein
MTLDQTGILEPTLLHLLVFELESVITGLKKAVTWSLGCRLFFKLRIRVCLLEVVYHLISNRIDILFVEKHLVLLRIWPNLSMFQNFRLIHFFNWFLIARLLSCVVERTMVNGRLLNRSLVSSVFRNTIVRNLKGKVNQVLVKVVLFNILLQIMLVGRFSWLLQDF